MSRTEVQQFFERYRDAFNRLDGNAVADLWHNASGITDSRENLARITWWPDDASMRSNQLALCAAYRDNGYGRADFQLIDCLELGVHHAFANLQWLLWRADGRLLQAFRTGYQLMRTADGPRVVLATAYEEVSMPAPPSA